MEVLLIILQIIAFLFLGYVIINNYLLIALISNFDDIDESIQDRIIETVTTWARYNYNKKIFTTSFITSLLVGTGSVALWLTTTLVSLPIMGLATSASMIFADKRLSEIVRNMEIEDE